ncbi:MAG TPA: preprotein translocase subunit SecY, partial [Marmoricola sp.]|nr:preprotein translocase subunit SecY [Marmoricola sp.]
MLGAFMSAFRTPDLRKKLLFVLFIIAVFRLGSQVPAPGVNTSNVQACFQNSKDGIYGLINMFSGGALLQLTIFALGIMPYITASIILQLLVVV